MFFDHFVEDIRKTIACICCLVILGPFLFIIGIWQFASAPVDTTRQNNINSMNTAILSWSTNYQNFFAGHTFTIDSSTNTSPQPLYRSNSQDFSSSEGLNSYVPVKFQIQTPYNSLIPSMAFKDMYKANIYFTPNGTTEISIQVEVFSAYDTTDSQTTCLNNYGRYFQGTCSYYYAISEICLKVSQQNGRLQLDTTYGGPGCWYSNNYPDDNGLWIPARYVKIPYSSLQNTINFNNIPVTVRHQNDPFIYAEYLTHGTLSFGLTPGEKLLIGAALMGIGGFFMLPCCIFIIVFTVCYRRKHHHHHYHVIG